MQSAVAKVNHTIKKHFQVEQKVFIVTDSCQKYFLITLCLQTDGDIVNLATV